MMELQQLQHVQLRWTDHRSSTWSELEGLLRNENLVDITLAAEGRFLKAHRVVLSVCSPYFQELLSAPHKDKEPIIFLTNVTYTQLEAVLKYMYKGEVQLPQRDLMSFIHVAKALKIRGLSDLSPNEQEQNMQPNDYQDNGRSDCGRQDSMGHGQQQVNAPTRRMEPNNSRVQPTVPAMNAATDVGMGMQNQPSISPVSVFSSTSTLQKAADQSTDDIFASFHHADAAVNFATAVEASLPSTSAVTNHLQAVTSSATFIHSSGTPDLMNTDQANQFQISQFEIMSAAKRDAGQEGQHGEEEMMILPNVGENDPIAHSSNRQNGTAVGRINTPKERKAPKAKRFIHVPDGCRSDADGVYECPKCFRRYRHMASCQRHIKLECGKAPQFQCMNCGKKFKFRFRLANHYRICKRMNNYAGGVEKFETGVDKFESGSTSAAATTAT